eukprot:14477674-Alexandrium_andersonii.AAC.1
MPAVGWSSKRGSELTHGERFGLDGQLRCATTAFAIAHRRVPHQVVACPSSDRCAISRAHPQPDQAMRLAPSSCAPQPRPRFAA